MVLAAVKPEKSIKNNVNKILKFALNRWLNPSGVEVEQDRTKQQPEGILSLTNMQEANVGNYTCVAENIAGRSTKSVWIVVSGKCWTNISYLPSPY